MSELLENWILQQLGYVIKINASSIGKHFQDGILFKKLLHSYGVLSNCQTVDFEQSSYFRVCRTNLLHLSPYFKLLNIECDEDAINDIATGKGSTIIRILYELYICFENRKHIYFITSQAEREVLKNCIPSKYDVTSSEMFEDHLKNEEAPYRNLAYPLIKHKQVTDWYKGKYEQIKLRIEKAKQAVKVESFSGSDFTQLKYLEPKRTIECETLDLPQISSTRNISMCSHDNQDNLMSYDEYMHSLKLKKNKTKMYKSLVNKMENMLFEDMWSKILCMQEEVFYKDFTKTLMKHSQYEKCIATKLFQIQHTSTLQNENRKQATCLLGQVTEARNEVKFEFDKAKGIFNDEKLRNLELHKKLYANKLRRRYERHYGTCLETLDAIIDLVWEKNMFEKKNNCSVPLSLWNDWKEMFLHLRSPHESQIEVPLTGNIEEYEEILINKFYTESVLNDHDTDEYLRFSGEWTTEEISTIIGEPMERQIILGFIVHRLLEGKYPLPAPPQPADLPQMTTAAIILKLHDKDAQDKLGKLLTKPAIYIFDLQTVINHCLETYTTEIKSPDASEVEKPSEKKKLTKTKLGKSKQPKKSKKKKASTDVDENFKDNQTVNPNDKETQTTEVTEEKEVDAVVQHTALGLQGKYLIKCLNSGNNIPDPLAVKVIIEYIKSLGNINGWVLLNFPVTVVQASVLELALTGTSFPIDNGETDESDKSHISTDGTDKSQLKDIRVSKLVPYPKQMERTQTYKTHFTTFINLVGNKTADHRISISKQNAISNKENSVSDIGKNHMPPSKGRQSEEISTDESFVSVNARQSNNLQHLQSIYSNQGIYNEFNYTTFDLETVKNLARLLLGEEDKLNRKPSVDLFGQDALDKLMLPLKGMKKKISPKTKKESPKSSVTKKSKKQQIEPSKITEELPEQKNETLISDHEKNVSSVQEPQSISSNIEIKSSVAPGDDEWQYSIFVIPDTLLISLATIWENTEISYLDNMKNLFFIKRTLNSRLIPYINFIRQTSTEAIEKSDNRQDLVSVFQVMFNSVDNDLRQHTEQKQQLHCKIYELQRQLWKLCDEKKNDIEQKVTDLIHENWASNEMCNLTNTYLQMIQTEMNRCINTLQLLCDYYLAMQGKILSETNIVPITISNIDMKSLSAEKVGKKINSLIINKSIYSTMFDILTSNYENGNRILSPFHEIIENSVESACSKVVALKKQIQSTIQKEQSVQKGKEEPKKTKGKEMSSHKSSQLEDMTVKQNLFVEWEAVVNQEIDRVIYRFKLIKYRALKDLTLWKEEVQAIFNSSFNLIVNRYHAEIGSVDNLCGVLRSAVEEETPIYEKLVLIKDRFFVDTNSLLLNRPPVHGVKELEEQVLDCQFTIEQLGNFLKIMKYVSPKGILGISTFVYILQDIVHQSSICNKKFLPKVWDTLKLSEIESVIEKIAFTSLHVDWKDFLIFCLDLDFPDLQEILEARLQFILYDPEKTEMTSLEKYNDIVLWFEKDLPKNPEAALRVVRVKEFLYKLFQVSKDKMNYTAFLLYFCRDTDPRVGFGKALALALGKGIILCEKYLYLEEKDNLIIIDQILRDIIEDVIQSVAGVVIKELSFHTVSDGSASVSQEEMQSHTRTLSIEEECQPETFRLESDQSTENTDTFLLYKLSGYSSFSEAPHSQQHCDECDISFKTDLCQDIKWISRIPVETVLAVLASTVFKTNMDVTSSCVQEIISSIYEADDFQDGCISAHILINLDCMKNKLFSKFLNFQIISVSEEILKVINKSNDNLL